VKFTELHLHHFKVLHLRSEPSADQPPVLVEFQARMADIKLNPQLFPMLGCGKGQRRFLFTSANRERRCERLDMMARTMAALGRHADLLSLSNGTRDKDGRCHPITELQLGKELRIGGGADDGFMPAHDTTGMRAMRSALRDLDDGGLISRAQPKVQYCAEGLGGCGRSIPRGGTCECGRRHLWRWKSFPTVITVSKKAFEVVGLLEELEAAQEYRYEQQRAGIDGPQPEKDVRVWREQKRIVRAQAMAAKRAQIETHHDPKLVAFQKAQLERLQPEKKLE
jgi:hypothetical protein